MRALVTGAGGFVGQHLVSHLLESGDEVIASSILASQVPEQVINAGLSSRVSMDVSDNNACIKVISEVKPDVIYHLAGIAFVPEAENDFSKALLVNVGGANNILRTCHLLQTGITVVLVSSAEVYGRISVSDLPVVETTAARPANNYSLSKLMGEMVVGRYDQFGYVRAVVMRPFNHTGPGQGNNFVASSFAYQLSQIAKKRAPAEIYVGNLEAKRDFSDVRDIVRAYRLAAIKGAGTYNLCSGNPIRIRSILETLIEVSGIKVEIKNDPARMRPAEVMEMYGSYAKAKSELGWEPRYHLRDTLSDLYNYWLSAP